MAMRYLGEKAGVIPCHPHRFRRTFALWCLRDGTYLHLLRNGPQLPGRFAAILGPGRATCKESTQAALAS